MAYRPATWEARFLELYKASGNVTLSARGCGINRNSVYYRRDQHPQFAEIMDAAHIEAVEGLEATAWQRAKTQSDTLLIFLLKALKPEMYRENIKITIEGGVSVETINQAILAMIAHGTDPTQAFERIIAKAHADAHSG
jgi:hypothetical protein